MNSNYAPWKYMSNGVCAYKELPIWTLHVEVMPSWLWVIFEIEWTITCQPYMGFSSSWTFWKGENKIYNFHVEQIFIWSFLGHVALRSKTFHFWKLQLQVTFYFLAIFVLTWFSPFLSFDMSNNTCSNMNEVYPTHFHLQIHQIMYSWPQLTFQLIDEFGNA